MVQAIIRKPLDKGENTVHCRKIKVTRWPKLVTMIVFTDDPIQDGDWFINENDRPLRPYKAEKNRFGHLGYNPRDYTPGAWFEWIPLGERHKRLAVSPVLIRQVLDNLGLLHLEKEVMAGYLENLKAPISMPFARFAEFVHFMRETEEFSAEKFIAIMRKNQTDGPDQDLPVQTVPGE